MDTENGVGYLDTESGEEVIAAQFEYFYTTSLYGGAGDFFDDGYAVAKKGELYGVIDRQGKWVIEPRFEDFALK